MTPCILNYQGKPFDHFSRQKLEPETGFYPQYQVISELKKIKGNPDQDTLDFMQQIIDAHSKAKSRARQLDS
jgi:hypothetical protein